MSKRPIAHINVRVPQEVKAELEALAAKENIQMAEYVRRHFQDLLLANKIAIADQSSTDARVQIPNPYFPNDPPPFQYPWMPGQPIPAQPIYPGTPYGGYSPYGYPAAPQPDALDQMFNEMRKMFVAKMMMELMKGNSSSEDFIRAYRGEMQQKPKEEDFSFEKMMKWQFFTQQQEREMQRAQNVLALAQSKGDKAGEQGAMSMITALIANQSAQAQTFLQQMMAVTQSSSAQQMNLFTVAMGQQRQTESEKYAATRETDQRIDAMRDQFQQAQLGFLQTLNQTHVDNLKMEMERIRNEKSKDTLAQISELLKLRQDPVYKAAFDAAFGVQNEGMLERLIPQLKDLGVGNILERVGTFLAGMVRRPTVPSPGLPAIPSLPIVPVPATGQPTQAQTGPEKLEELQIPINVETEKPAAPQTQTTESIVAAAEKREFTATPEPPANLMAGEVTTSPENAIGYTNLEEEKKPNPQGASEPVPVVAPPPEPITTEQNPVVAPTENPQPSTQKRTRKSR